MGDMQALLQLLHFEENFIRYYAVQKLDEICNDEELDLFMLQLVQALNFENLEEDENSLYSPLSRFLIDRVSRSNSIILTTNFYWFVKVESENDRKKGKKYKFILKKF